MELTKSKIGGILGIIMILIISALFCGCTGEEKKDDNGNGSEGDNERSISISGSTTVQPIAVAAAEDWMNAHSKDIITVSAGGSSVGIKDVAAGTSDIGMASRELKQSEKDENPDLVQHIVAKDGIGIIVHKNNPITGLTLEQVKKMYLGEITNWNEIGGPDKEIVIVGRDSASGTRATFDELVLDDQDPSENMQQKQSNGQVHETIKTNENAIGYVGLGYVDVEVKGVPIDGVEPTVTNVQLGNYPISRNLNMFTKGAATGLAKDFIDYLLSTEGQQIVSDEGFVPIA